MASPLYTGSQLLLPIASSLGLPVDQLNFVAVETSGILLGFLLRKLIPHSANKPKWRLLYCLVFGVAFLFFLIGKSSMIVFAQIFLCYMVMKYFPEAYMHIVVFCLAFGYLIMLFMFRFSRDLDLMCYDETYSVMVTTQKVTTLAFAISDYRLLQKGEKMAPEREKWAVRKLPSLLEYLAFNLSFQGVLAGPFCHWNLYRAFIEGNTKERLSEETKFPVRYEDDPSTCLRAVATKVCAVVFWIYLTAFVKPNYPDDLNTDADFIASNGYVYRIWYLYISLFLHRTKYYVSWILADAVYNASGLGYEGKDENGMPRWTGMSNVDVIKIETSSSLKVYLDNWNIKTSQWLRHVCYTRAPFHNTLLTFVLSALWHGIFAGYYITFVGATFFVLAGRRIRTNIRPLFQGSHLSRFVYEVITIVGTHISLAYIVLSFVILDLDKIYRFHKSFYFALYIIVVLACIFLPPGKRRSSSPTTKQSKEPEVSETDPQGNQQQQTEQLNGSNSSKVIDSKSSGMEESNGTSLNKREKREGESVQKA